MLAVLTASSQAPALCSRRQADGERLRQRVRAAVEQQRPGDDDEEDGEGRAKAQGGR